MTRFGGSFFAHTFRGANISTLCRCVQGGLGVSPNIILYTPLDKVQDRPYSESMASTPEGKVKQRVVYVLTTHGAYYFFPSMYGYGRAGIPDIIVCHRGRFVAIECKAGKGTTTKLQDRELDRIRKAGGAALVVNENNIDLVVSVLKEIEDVAEQTAEAFDARSLKGRNQSAG